MKIMAGVATETETVEEVARRVAEEVFASKIAAALADPDVKGKSALGYLLGKVRRR